MNRVKAKAMREAFGVRPACRRFGTCEKREQARRTPNAGAPILLSVIRDSKKTDDESPESAFICVHLRLRIFGQRPPVEASELHFAVYSQPICRPRFCSCSQLINGLKYSIIARVERSSPVASRRTFRQSSVPPFFMMSRRNVPICLLPA